LSVHHPADPGGNGARWRLAVAVLLIGALIAFTGPQHMWRTLRTASPPWALAAAFLLVPWFLCGAVNVWLLLRRLAPVPFPMFVQVYAASWTTSLVLPGQLGDATQVLLLRRYGVPVSVSSAAYATDKVLSLAFMLAVASAGVVLYGPVEVKGSLVGFLAGGAFLGLAILVLLLSLGVSTRGPLARLGQALTAIPSSIAVFAREPQLLWRNLALTIVKWLLMIASYACAFRALGFFVPVSAAATLPVMSSLVGYLPISAGGLGTTEWTAVALFGKLDVPGPTVVTAFLFLRTSVIAIAILMFGARRREL